MHVHVILEAAHENLIAEDRDRLTEGSTRRVQKLESRLPARVALPLEEVGRARTAPVKGSADQDAVAVDLNGGAELRALLGIVCDEEVRRPTRPVPLEDVGGPGIGEALIVPASSTIRAVSPSTVPRAR